MNLFSSINYTDSWSFTKLSFLFLAKNRDLNILPIILLSVVMLGLSGLYLANSAWFYPLLLLLYFSFAFLMIYLNTVTTAIVLQRLANQPVGLSYGFRFANQYIVPIFYWTCLASTVGVLARLFEGPQQLLAKIIPAFGLSWNNAAYFVLPLMIHEKLTPLKAMDRSLVLIGRGFKKTVSVRNFLLIFFIFVLLIVSEFMLTSPDELIHALLFIVPIFTVTFLIASMLETILASALYLNTTRQGNPVGFEKALLDRAFVKEF